jgi:hypothetical protein
VSSVYSAISRLAITLLAATGAHSAVAAGNIWCDPQTNLCWQNPQRSGFAMDDDGLIAAEAAPYCDSLVLDGYDDWRVPTIAELRTLVAGNPATEPGGDCPVAADTSTRVGFMPSCHGAERFAGPAAGCYWKDELAGRCDKPDRAAVEGKSLETWASDRAKNDPEHWVSFVSFDNGSAGFNHSCSAADVRCVRDDDGAMPACTKTNSCVDSPAYISNAELMAKCDADLCAASDAVQVTVHLPEELQARAHQLMVFWYKEEDWQMPPPRPPDGGTDYNQVLGPELSPGKPLTMSVPACTFYREEILYGDYRLYAFLQMGEGYRWQPAPGDYVWASDEPVSFPLNGKDHEAAIAKLDITLSRVTSSGL